MSAFVDSYLKGLTGIEIGGSAHNDFGLDAINVDRYAEMDTIYKEAEKQLCGSKRPIDVVANGEELPFENDSYDFVFSSHVIEHIPDPIGALLEWVRVARQWVVLSVPQWERSLPEDQERGPTPIDLLMERYETAFRSKTDTHWSVWSLESFLHMCERAGLEVNGSLDPDDQVGNSFMVAIKPHGANPIQPTPER